MVGFEIGFFELCDGSCCIPATKTHSKIAIEILQDNLQYLAILAKINTYI
jgi:hypothetical protein